jgi:hypothetical protein
MSPLKGNKKAIPIWKVMKRKLGSFYRGNY